MRVFILIFFLCLVRLHGFTQTKANGSYPQIEIPFKKFVLTNGLTLIVHEDHKAPIASSNIWFHVGSKDEGPGKTGLTHLYEHLMFNGSEHYNRNFYQLMDSIGAFNCGAYTTFDRTVFAQNFPSNALDVILWAESDRMGFFLPTLDTVKLIRQKEIIFNEMRQSESWPYNRSFQRIQKSTYPPNHPYSWPTIGYVEDLSAASLEDVKAWFNTYFVPNNAVMVIAGDVNTEEVYEKVEKYFGNIPAGLPKIRSEDWISKMTGTKIETIELEATNARITKVWNIPGYGTPDAVYLLLLSKALNSDNSFRLHRRLTQDKKLAVKVFAYTNGNEIGDQFSIGAETESDTLLSAISDIIGSEINLVIQNGISEEELHAAKMIYFTEVLNNLDAISALGKSGILAVNELYSGDAGYYKKIYELIRKATVMDLQKAAQKWLSDGEYVLNVVPFKNHKASNTSLERTQMPKLGTTEQVTFPKVEHFTMSNGLNVYLLERKEVPKINMSLRINAGAASDPAGLSGLAQLTANYLRLGSVTTGANPIDKQLAGLGASINTSVSMDATHLKFDAPKSSFPDAFRIFKNVLMYPSFPQKELEQVKSQQIATIKNQQANTNSLSSRLRSQLFFAKAGSDGSSSTETGAVGTVSKLSRSDVLNFYDNWFAPNNASLYVVGDIESSELKTILERELSSWKRRKFPQYIPSAVGPPSSSVYLVDKPNASQTTIMALLPVPVLNHKDKEIMGIISSMLGAERSSRLMMNLRENKHWAYDAWAEYHDLRHGGLLEITVPVQTDKTKQSILEIAKEMDEFVTTKAPTKEETEKVKYNAINRLPIMWEKNQWILGSMEYYIEKRGLDFFQRYPALLIDITHSDVNSVAKEMIRPEKVTWLLIGDISKIEKGIKELNLGPVTIINEDGEVVR